MKTKPQVKLFLAVLITTLSLVSAATEPLALFGSGTDPNGVVLPIGSVDPRITIVDRTDGVPGTSTYVVDDSVWMLNDATSEWLSANPDRHVPIYAQWTYRVPIDLSGYDPTTVNIQARVTSDNDIVWTHLNGSDVGFTTPSDGYTEWHTLLLTNGFIRGTNFLDFRLNDTGGASGFRIELSGSGTRDFILGIEAYAGISISGPVGSGYRIEYATSLPSTNWQTLSYLTLPTSP